VVRAAQAECNPVDEEFPARDGFTLGFDRLAILDLSHH
jgi:hypothetical protein